jgi:squalene-hopene/tetraprenyl-beta-curcumene cyclase
MLAPSLTRVPIEGRLRAAITRASAAAAWWREQATLSPAGHLLSVPDIGLSCEILLADRLFHDLSPAERQGLAGWVRANQQPSGAWLDHAGSPDLSRTALGWWALVESGDDPDAEHLVRARRIVHELGGAQRGSIELRLWLAMAGHMPWAWLPTMPAELWLLPTLAWLSPSRVSPWARGVMTPYLLLSRAPAQVHVSSAASLLLTRPDGEPILPRLVQPGLAGDLLQAFDQSVKLIRKLPRGPILAAALARVQRWLVAAQQSHGGWFSVRPTLLSLIALRVMGANFDDPRIVRGLAYLRRARGLARLHGRPHLVQGLTCPRWRPSLASPASLSPPATRPARPRCPSSSPRRSATPASGSFAPTPPPAAGPARPAPTSTSTPSPPAPSSTPCTPSPNTPATRARPAPPCAAPSRSCSPCRSPTAASHASSAASPRSS